MYDRVIKPCARCGDPEGRSLGRRPFPARFLGGEWGIAGEVCRDCRDDLIEEATASQCYINGTARRLLIRRAIVRFHAITVKRFRREWLPQPSKRAASERGAVRRGRHEFLWG